MGEGYRHAVKALGLRSAMLAPLVARDRVIGVITLATRAGRGGRTRRRISSRRRRSPATSALAIDDAGLDRALQGRGRRSAGTRQHVAPGVPPAAGDGVGRRPVAAIHVRGGPARRRRGPERQRRRRDQRLRLSGDARRRRSGHRAPPDGADREGQSFDYQYRGRWYTVLIDPLQGRRRVGDRLRRRRLRHHGQAHGGGAAGAERIAPGGGAADRPRRQLRMGHPVQHRRVDGRASPHLRLRGRARSAAPWRRSWRGCIPTSSSARRRSSPMPCTSGGRSATTTASFAPTADAACCTPAAKSSRTRRATRSAWSGTCWDITELAEATQARERLLSLLQATIDATADGILVVDRDRKVVLSNRRFVQLVEGPARARGAATTRGRCSPGCGPRSRMRTSSSA